ncbi:MAG: uL15 family ribosomal protein [Candidatus Micrarchaeota archaeon]
MASRRKAGQKKKYLGKRSFGCGNCKNRRGSGNRGGRGKAGICKHKGTWAAKYAPGYFGKHGFANPNSKSLIKVAHLFDINRRAILGKLEKSGDKFVFQFKGKVLATGNVTVPLLIKANAWSKRTEEKVKAAGGDISNLG